MGVAIKVSCSGDGCHQQSELLFTQRLGALVSEEELQDGQICDAAITFAINLWRSGEEDYANATPPEYKAHFKWYWARRVDWFPKEVSSIYPQAEYLTFSDIERQVQAT